MSSVLARPARLLFGIPESHCRSCRLQACRASVYSMEHTLGVRREISCKNVRNCKLIMICKGKECLEGWFCLRLHVMPWKAYLEDRSTECDCEEVFNMAGQGGAARHNEPDPPTKRLLEGLEQQLVQQGSRLHSRITGIKLLMDFCQAFCSDLDPVALARHAKLPCTA